MIGASGTLALAAFDYVQLATGDLACLTWATGSGEAWAGVVFYACREVAGARAVTLGAGHYWKLVVGKNVAAVRAYSDGLRGVELIRDPVGATMVQIGAKDVVRHYSGREYVDSRFAEKPLAVVLPLLGAPVTCVGVSGSTLLEKKDPDDLDVIIYDAEVGQRVARAIKSLVAEDKKLWLRGYWGRAYHHRRFRIDGINVCTKFPLPLQSPHPWLGAQLVGSGLGLTGEVVRDEWGHCSPAHYCVRTTESSPLIAKGEQVDVYSNESAHSMAFSLGDVVSLSAPSVFRSSGKWIVTIPMGDLDAIRPAENDH